jgi:hypothetical protein
MPTTITKTTLTTTTMTAGKTVLVCTIYYAVPGI